MTEFYILFFVISIQVLVLFTIMMLLVSTDSCRIVVLLYTEDFKCAVFQLNVTELGLYISFNILLNELLSVI